MWENSFENDKRIASTSSPDLNREAEETDVVGVHVADLRALFPRAFSYRAPLARDSRPSFSLGCVRHGVGTVAHNGCRPDSKPVDMRKPFTRFRRVGLAVIVRRTRRRAFSPQRSLAERCRCSRLDFARKAARTQARVRHYSGTRAAVHPSATATLQKTGDTSGFFPLRRGGARGRRHRKKTPWWQPGRGT